MQTKPVFFVPPFTDAAAVDLHGPFASLAEALDFAKQLGLANGWDGNSAGEFRCFVRTCTTQPASYMRAYRAESLKENAERETRRAAEAAKVEADNKQYQAWVDSGGRDRWLSRTARFGIPR